jgi:prepilin-type N-terminal cleavage/methylation domain-containing protein/prepilin-type processing-associated H-X9-DG protein
MAAGTFTSNVRSRYMSRRIRNDKRRGFTLVELLVVIGIITVLISILLPALNKARRSAKTVQCASNLKQIAMAVLTYTSNSKGKLIPDRINALGSGNPYPDGFTWQAELVHQGYIKAPNVFDLAGKRTYPDYSRSVFYCSEGLDPDFYPPQSNNQGAYPTDPKNNVGYYGIAPNPRKDGQAPYGVLTWYQLNSRIVIGSNVWPGGSRACPFVYYRTASEVADPRNTRNISCVKKSSSLVMIAEAADQNWVDQSVSDFDGVKMGLLRLGARHGKRTGDGRNAYSNFAFFDGHVSLLPTLPIETKGKDGERSQTPDAVYLKESDGLVIYLGSQ